MLYAVCRMLYGFISYHIPYTKYDIHLNSPLAPQPRGPFIQVPTSSSRICGTGLRGASSVKRGYMLEHPRMVGYLTKYFYQVIMLHLRTISRKLFTYCYGTTYSWSGTCSTRRGDFTNYSLPLCRTANKRYSWEKCYRVSFGPCRSHGRVYVSRRSTKGGSKSDECTPIVNRILRDYTPRFADNWLLTIDNWHRSTVKSQRSTVSSKMI